MYANLALITKKWRVIANKANRHKFIIVHFQTFKILLFHGVHFLSCFFPSKTRLLSYESTDP